jgi:FkbM family methyltransferase
VPLDESMASLMDWTGGRVGTVSVHTCEVERLDDLVARRELRRPDFIKCDTEGCEARIFAGGARTIDCEPAPTILYEGSS